MLKPLLPLLLAFQIQLLAPLTSAAYAATSEEIKDIAREMVCLCGSCNRESLATCLCTAFAVPQREAIGVALDAGKTKQEIIDAYIDRYGQLILAVPPAVGFNLAAWIAPFAALVFGIFLVRSVLVNWSRNQASATSQGGVGEPTIAAQDSYRERLRQELDHFDDED